MGNDWARAPTQAFWSHAVMFGLVLFGLIVICLWRPAPWPDGDAPRYIALGVNLYEHGVLSDAHYRADVDPNPALPMGGPLVAAEIAIGMALDEVTRQSLICFSSGKSCEFRISSLRILHAIELWAFLICLWMITRLILGGSWTAWGSVFVAMFCKEMYEGHELVLTEPLFLGTVGPFLLAWLYWLDEPGSLIRAALMGLTLSLVCLVKPVFLAVVPLPLMAALLAPMLKRSKQTSPRQFLMACLAYAMVIIPTLGSVMAYHKACCNVASLNSPYLLEAALAHRVAYNAMSLPEWLVGWIYYLPDFGDNAARSIFPQEYWSKLGWEDDGYYVLGRDVLHSQARALTNPNSATRHLLETYVFPDIGWHAMVSLLLLWRGIFIGKYWGLIALPFAAWFGMRAKVSAESFHFLLLLAPVALVAVLQSGLSVSINRYNLGFIYPYSIAIVWIMRSAIPHIRTVWRWHLGRRT